MAYLTIHKRDRKPNIKAMADVVVASYINRLHALGLVPFLLTCITKFQKFMKQYDLVSNITYLRHNYNKH